MAASQNPLFDTKRLQDAEHSLTHRQSTTVNRLRGAHTLWAKRCVIWAPHQKDWKHSHSIARPQRQREEGKQHQKRKSLPNDKASRRHQFQNFCLPILPFIAVYCYDCCYCQVNSKIFFLFRLIFRLVACCSLSRSLWPVFSVDGSSPAQPKTKTFN